MLKINFGTDGMMVVGANAKMFIVPNPAKNGTTRFAEKTVEKIRRDCELNGLKLNQNEQLVQVWIVSKEDLNTDNLGDEGFHIATDKLDVLYSSRWYGHIPASVLYNKKEGDTLDWKIYYKSLPVRESADASVSKRDMILELHITLCQSEFRYRRFGRFEDVLKQVLPEQVPGKPAEDIHQQFERVINDTEDALRHTVEECESRIKSIDLQNVIEDLWVRAELLQELGNPCTHEEACRIDQLSSISMAIAKGNGYEAIKLLL